ncbi:MAG: hypothetical protein Q9162_007265 [Coniocarpon cinnabarinum]
MVTHVPPSPSLSSASLSTVTGSLPPPPRRHSSRAHSKAPSTTASRYAPSSYRPPAPHYPPTTFPPSPPLSHSYASSPPSSYVAPRLPESYAQSQYPKSRGAPSVAPSRATEAARHGRQRHHAQSQAESRHHFTRRSGSRARSVESSTSGENDRQSNEFPWFEQSGDVEITLKNRHGRTERRYKLHNLILRQNSKWFDDKLDGVVTAGADSATTLGGRGQESIHPDYRGQRAKSTFSARSSKRRTERQDSANETDAQNANPPRWRFELDWSSAASRDGFPMLVPRQSTSPSHSPTRAEQPQHESHAHSFLRNLTNRRRSHSSSSATNHANPSSATVIPPPANDEEETDILHTYASLLATIYNHPPALDPNSLPDAYVQSKLLLRLATLYGTLPIVRPRIEHHLLHFHKSLYRNIARYPPSYLKLGHLLQSRKIFHEALVHVVAQWPVHDKYLTDVDERVRDLVLDKHEELTELQQKVDGRLFRLPLRTSRGEKVGPAHFVDWMAMCLFREWLAEQTPLAAKSGILKTSPPPSASARADGKVKPTPAIPGRPYHLMMQGGEAYLPRTELKHFLKHQAPVELYSRDNLKRFERRTDELKAGARDATRPLCRSFLEGEGGGEGLYCTRLEEGDWSWLWGT